MRWLAVLLLLEAVVFARPRATLVALDLGTAPAYLRSRATTQIEQGLAATGYDVIPAVGLSPALASCRTSDCMREVGRALGAKAILVAAVIPRGESSSIELHLFDGETGRELATLTELCDLCGETELVEHLGIAASAVRARAAEPHRESRPASLIPGIVVGAAGTAMILTGVYLVHLDGRGACGAGDTPVYPDPNAVIRFPDPNNHAAFICRDNYKTETAGIVGVGLGAAAVVLGVVLAVHAHGRTIEIVPTPTSAAMRVTFAW